MNIFIRATLLLIPISISSAAIGQVVLQEEGSWFVAKSNVSCMLLGTNHTQTYGFQYTEGVERLFLSREEWSFPAQPDKSFEIVFHRQVYDNDYIEPLEVLIGDGFLTSKGEVGARKTILDLDLVHKHGSGTTGLKIEFPGDEPTWNINTRDAWALMLSYDKCIEDFKQTPEAAGTPWASE